MSFFLAWDLLSINAINRDGIQTNEKHSSVVLHYLPTNYITELSGGAYEPPPATCSCHPEVLQNPLILFYFPTSLLAAALVRLTRSSMKGGVGEAAVKLSLPPALPRPAWQDWLVKGWKGGRPCTRGPAWEKGGQDSSWVGTSWRSGGSTVLESERELVNRGGSGLRNQSEGKSCPCHSMMDKRDEWRQFNGLLLPGGGASDRRISVHPVVASQHGSIVKELDKTHYLEVAHISHGTKKWL